MQELVVNNEIKSLLLTFYLNTFRLYKFMRNQGETMACIKGCGCMGCGTIAIGMVVLVLIISAIF